MAIESSGCTGSSTGTARACPTGGGTSSPPARRSGRCSPSRAGAPRRARRRPPAHEALRGGPGFELTDEVRTLVAGHAALLVLGLDESAVRRRRHDRRARPGDAPHGPDGRPGQGRADGRARRRRRRGPPRRRPDHARVVVGPPRGRPTCASAATSCCTSSATSSTCSTARSTAPRRSDDAVRGPVDRGAAPPSTGAVRERRPTAGCGPTPARTRASSSPSPPRRSSPCRWRCTPTSRRCTTSSWATTARTRPPACRRSSSERAEQAQRAATARRS